jgi:hypothetical protein
VKTLDCSADLLEINRSEAPKSVALSYLLRKADLVRCFFRLPEVSKWTKRATGGDAATGTTSLGPIEGPFEATALFHTVRDLAATNPDFLNLLSSNRPDNLPELPRNEIDVLFACKNLLIGFELKWLTAMSGIEKQLQSERECLTIMAKFMNVGYTSLVVIAPDTQTLPNLADGGLSWQELDLFAKNMVLRFPESDVAKLVADEFGAATSLLQVPSRQPWTFLSLEQLRAAALSSEAGSRLVGYEQGLDHLRQLTPEQIRKRSKQKWRVADRLERNMERRNWHPLPVVVAIIQEILGR